MLSQAGAGHASIVDKVNCVLVFVDIVSIFSFSMPINDCLNLVCREVPTWRQPSIESTLSISMPGGKDH